MASFLARVRKSKGRAARPGTGHDDLVLTLESTPRAKLAKKSHNEGCLRPLGEYYRAFVVMEDRVTKWPAPRDEVEYDVLRVNVNVHTN